VVSVGTTGKINKKPQTISKDADISVVIGPTLLTGYLMIYLNADTNISSFVYR